ncbi:MAG TPA: hypothetical protein VEU62_21555 [Bryobacterales bacterium]|nr:hypothetical protein [Bryobacterales bacterium]
MNLPRLLQDLHAEKRWLETMIAALEIASRTPAHRFTGVLISSLEDGELPECILHLGKQKKAQLARLAEQVRRDDLRKRSQADARLVSIEPDTRRRVAVA